MSKAFHNNDLILHKENTKHSRYKTEDKIIKCGSYLGKSSQQ